jgi:predicted RNase H-like nuclease
MPSGDRAGPRPVLGADGCKGGGWVAAELTEDQQFVAWHHAASTPELLSLMDQLGAERLALDVPIGLPDDGTRQADDLARRVLGARRSSVFAAPRRAVLDLAGGTYAAARRQHASLSAQSYALVARIKEVDDALRSHGPHIHGRVAECHPEVSFRQMTGHVLETKKSAVGAFQRLAALERVLGAELPRDVPLRAALDDALDAVACAWSAARWLRGEAQQLPPDVTAPVDGAGVPMRILY